jgi:hypothetical protein
MFHVLPAPQIYAVAIVVAFACLAFGLTTVGFLRSLD